MSKESIRQTFIDKYPSNIDDINLNVQRFFELDVKQDNSSEKILKNKNSPTIFKLLYHLSSKKEIILMILGASGSIISAIAGPIMSYNFGGAINNFSDIQNIEIKNPKYLKEIEKFIKNIDIIITRYLILGGILFISHFLQSFCWQYSAFLQIDRLKENYFSLLMNQEQEFFDNNNPYELATKVQNQLEIIELGLGDKFGFVIQKFVTVITGIIVSFLVSWRLSLVILTLAPVTLFFIFCFTSTIKNASIISRAAYEKAGGTAEEMIYNIQTIFSFCNFDFEIERFNRNVDNVFKCDKNKAIKYGLSQSIIAFSNYLGFTIAIFYGKKLILENEEAHKNDSTFKVGDILAVILSMNTAIWSFSSIAPNLKIIIDAISSCQDYFQLLNRKPKIYVSLFQIKKPKEDIIGLIEFRHIDFSYDKKKILDNFSLRIYPGKKIALVGESGCGKSTVVNLLERIYEIEYNNEYSINNGIFLDGDNIKDYDLEYYRSLIGYVQQEPVLFNKSIKDNIIFGREELIKSMNLDINELLEEACILANINEFISKLPGKLNYKVGIRGSKLSGGQKQRIAIARAVLLEPKIIILDEATSALDYKSELEVQKALDNLKMKSITTFVISHRLKTIINSDIIYFMKDGKIVEEGTHKELFFENGLYKKLIKNQVDENGDLLKTKNININYKQNSFELELVRRRSLILFHNIKKNKNKSNFSTKELFLIVRDKNYLIKLGIFSSILLGMTMTLCGYFFGFTINSLSEPNESKLERNTNIWGIIYFINSIFISVFMFLKLYSLEVISSFLTCNLRKKILRKYLELSMSFFDRIENSPGALLTKLSMDTVQLNSIFQMIIGDIFHTLGAIISGLSLSIYYDWRLTLISFFFIPFIIFSNLLIAQTKRSGRKSYKKNSIEAGAILSESVLNTKTIFSFNFQKQSVKLYMEIINSETKNFLRDSILFGLLMGLGVFCSFMNHSTLFYFSEEFFLNDTLDYKKMNITIQILILMISSLSSGIRGVFDIKIAKNSLKSIFNILNTVNEIEHTQKLNEDKISPNKIEGKIEFKNVYFKYPINLKEEKNNNYILNNVSFTIEQGQKVGIVGFSGSGKSTVIKLIERFYQPEKGNILIDGIDIQNYNLYELRKKIGLVGQEPIIFKRSLYENIKYGKLDAKRNEVMQAAKNSSIEYLLSGLDNNKYNISGGEKQRICIARAFLKNPKILLLDEPTSALDKKNENEINQSLNKLMKGRTTVIVTHRLDSIIDADVILVFKNGKLVEKGTHKELIQFGGEYTNLFALN